MPEMSVISWMVGRDLLLGAVDALPAETVWLANANGRVLARTLVAGEDVPPFDRSPYDGYALRAADTAAASREHPVTLSVLEEIPAGTIGRVPLRPGTAAKILTGAMIPKGADAVIPFEKTSFTDDTVTIFEPLKPGSNIVNAGEDVQRGTVLCEAGTRIDAGLMGTLAAQNAVLPEVIRRPRVGLISTGAELVEPGEMRTPGGIYNSSRYAFTAILQELGCEVISLGSIMDERPAIADRITGGLTRCDALILTGGVSVGDYDLTLSAMELAGVRILFRGVDMKPGKACCYGIHNGKLVCGLSGNPASAMTNFYAVALPAFRRLCGERDCCQNMIEVTLLQPFDKQSPAVRFLHGRLSVRDGRCCLALPAAQGNEMLSGLIGCDVMAIVPAGSGPLPAGTVLKGFQI